MPITKQDNIPKINLEPLELSLDKISDKQISVGKDSKNKPSIGLFKDGRFNRFATENNPELFISISGKVIISGKPIGSLGSDATLKAISLNPGISDPNITYKWFVDGTEVPNNNTDTLVTQYPLIDGTTKRISVESSGSLGSVIKSEDYYIKGTAGDEIYVNNLYHDLPDKLSPGNRGLLKIRGLSALSGNNIRAIITSAKNIGFSKWFENDVNNATFIYTVDENAHEGNTVEIIINLSTSSGAETTIKITSSVKDGIISLSDSFVILFPKTVTSGSVYDLSYNIALPNTDQYRLLLASPTNCVIGANNNLLKTDKTTITINSNLQHASEALIPWYLLDNGQTVLSGVLRAVVAKTPPNISTVKFNIYDTNNNEISEVVPGSIIKMGISQMPPDATSVTYHSDKLLSTDTNSIFNVSSTDASKVTAKVPDNTSPGTNIDIIASMSNGYTSAFLVGSISVVEGSSIKSFTSNGTFNKAQGVTTLEIIGRGGINNISQITGPNVNITFPKNTNVNGDIIGQDITKVITVPTASADFNIVVGDGGRITIRW